MILPPPDGRLLGERAPGVTVNQVVTATAAPLIVLPVVRGLRSRPPRRPPIRNAP